MLLSNCHGKTVLLAGWFNSDFLSSVGQEADLVYHYQLFPENSFASNSENMVCIDAKEFDELPEQSCDVVLVSYGMLFLDRNSRIQFANSLAGIIKAGAEIIFFEPVDEVQKKTQQQFLDALKKVIAQNGLARQATLVLPGSVTICNLLENNGCRIVRKELYSGDAVNNFLPSPLLNAGADASVHLLIKAVSLKSAESAYSIDNEAAKLKPREKLLGGFIEEMKLHELLAVIIGMGNKQEDVFSMSERIIREYGSKALAMETDPKRLMEILSIGEANACKLVSAFEIGRRFYSEKVKGRQLIRGPEDVFKYAEGMSELVKENFRGLYLNTKNYIIHDEVISIGHLTASLVHPREVFKPAIEYSAAGLIVLHNHPSGDPEPSIQDKEITEMLVKAGKTLGIPLLDHVIIGSGKFYSFNEKGQI